MKNEEIRNLLFDLRDTSYRDFQSKLIPTVEPERIIGVRTPQLRELARRLVRAEEYADFLAELPHRYFDEDQLHAFILSGFRDFRACAAGVRAFLPYVDNWATCDQLSPKSFAKRKADLIPYIEEWLASEHTYTRRFGVGMLMEHFLGDAFDIRYPEAVARIRSEEYYVNMMIAWYFATALAKQYAAVLPFIEEERLDAWTHNKAIQKAIESRRITPEQKEYLKRLKRKA